MLRAGGGVSVIMVVLSLLVACVSRRWRGGIDYARSGATPPPRHRRDDVAPARHRRDSNLTPGGALQPLPASRGKASTTMASQTNYDHVRAAYDAEQLHHGDGKASLDIEKAIKASQLGRDHRDQLRNDLASLRVGLRDALLWDYPQENGAAACERVAHELGATCVIVAGAPFLFTEPSKIARNRRPRFAVLDDQRGPRWARPEEDYHAKLHHAATIVQTAATTNATDAPVENALTGLAPPALWGWLLDYPCVYCFSEEQGDRAQNNLDNSVLFELCASSLEVRGPKCGVPLRLCDEAFNEVLASHINDLAGRRPQLFGEVAWFRSEPPPNSVVAL